MNIHYRIIEIFDKERLIVVRYYTDDLSEFDLAMTDDLRPDGTPIRCKTDLSISLPFPEPNKEQLELLMASHAPDQRLQYLEELKRSLQTLQFVYEINGIKYTKTQDEIKEIRNPTKKVPTPEELANLIKELNPK